MKYVRDNPQPEGVYFAIMTSLLYISTLITRRLNKDINHIKCYNNIVVILLVLLEENVSV